METETTIHPTAIVDPGAELGTGVEIGPYAIVGPRVRIGDRTKVGPHALIETLTEVGDDCVIHKGAVLGTDPQDLKFGGEETWLRVGNRTTVREFATLNRGTHASGRTLVGDDCLLMAYTHVAHDCELGNHVILSNAVNMAGHVIIGDHAIIGGVTPIHQFVRIGAYAFVGGGSRIPQDVPPYCRAAGNPPQLYGLNSVGLERKGFSAETRAALKTAYRLVFNTKGVTIRQGLDRAYAEVEQIDEVQTFLDFIRDSDRGVTS